MKKALSIALAMIMMCTCLCFTASARASLYLTEYSAFIKAGTKTGELRINYDVLATKTVSSVGVSKIVIYTASGNKVTTITGSTSNGLLRSGGTNMGTYSYTATSGSYYYAEVTVYAGDANGSDSRTITTATVKAP